MEFEVLDYETYTLYKIRARQNQYINYCYLIADKLTKQTAAVDPAWELDLFSSIIDSNNLDIKYVLLTHSHFDHTNLAEKIVNIYDCQALMHEEEISFFNINSLNLSAFKHLDLYYLGSTKITCLHTPGHTKGSSCFLLEHSLFTGDTVFNEGCGKCNLEGGSASEMYSSLSMLKSLIPSDVNVFPGHSFGTPLGMTFESMVENNIYFQIDDEKVFIDFRTRPMHS